MKNAFEIPEEMRANGEWNPELCEELCKLAGLEDEWKEADGETFEQVLYKAAKILDVEII